jgi:NAD(P)-dependent dehydrogenase (short-subunit alcohol dehydrogenase family)
MVSALLHDSSGSALQLSTNVLCHYTLTALLWPALAASRSPRVINVSSLRHFFSPAVFDDHTFHKRDYDPLKSDGIAKPEMICSQSRSTRKAKHPESAASLCIQE